MYQYDFWQLTVCEYGTHGTQQLVCKHSDWQLRYEYGVQQLMYEYNSQQLTVCEYGTHGTWQLTYEYGDWQLTCSLRPQASTSPLACYHKRVPPVDWLYMCTHRQESVPPHWCLSALLCQQHHNPVPAINLQGHQGPQDCTEEGIQDDEPRESQAVPRLGNRLLRFWCHHPWTDQIDSDHCQTLWDGRRNPHSYPSLRQNDS